MWILKWKLQDLEAGQTKLGVIRSQKKTVRPYKCATKMLWTLENGDS